MSLDSSKCHVALLAGGMSGEREVSLKSGEGAGKALEEAGFKVTMLDPAEKEDLKTLIDGGFDVAFLCTHGRMGEDGVLQGFLEMAGLPYTCSGVQASAIAIDKAKSKVLYGLNRIPTAPALFLEKHEPWSVDEVVSVLGEHCVIKPAQEGSSIGVRIVDTAADLAEAIEEAFTFDNTVVVEKFVAGIEVTAAVLGNNDPVALPLIQMIPKNEFYDFESKYAPGGSEHVCPAPISEELTAQVQNYACKAHKALGCSGVSRTDFIIEDNGDMWCLETNTIPGMTATSLLPDAANAAGISFPELCTKLIEYALEEK